jgi:hypothetical protein
MYTRNYKRNTKKRHYFKKIRKIKNNFCRKGLTDEGIRLQGLLYEMKQINAKKVKLNNKTQKSKR